MKSTLKFLVMLAMVPMFASCGSNGEETEAPAQPRQVKTVYSDSCTIDYRLPAQLRGRQDVEIRPQVTATLEELLVVEGQSVKKGQVMFVLNQTEFASILDNAKAKVESAEAQVKTMELEVQAQKELLEKNIVSEHQYKVTYNEYLMAKATLSEAKAGELHAQNDFNHTIIKAPYDGVVGNITYRQGALVGPQSKPLTIVSDNSTIIAYISVNELNYMYLVSSVGSKQNLIDKLPDCKLVFNDGSEYNTKGRIVTISGIVDKETGAISIRAAFKNPDGILTSGGSATVVIPMKSKAIVIPKTATYDIQDKTFAYKVVQNDTIYTVESAELEVLRLNDKEYAVYEGLEDGNVIAVEGVSKMYSGMKIKPVTEAKEED